VGHGPTLAGLDGQAGLRAVEGLDLALLVDGEDHRVARRGHVEPDDRRELGEEVGIARALEGADPVRLELVSGPDALHRAQRDPDGFGHGPAGPTGGLAGRLGAGQRHHPAHQPTIQGRLAGLPGLLAQEAVHPRFGVALLPAPDRRPADPGPPRHRRDVEPAGREQHQPGAGDVLLGPVPISHDRLQASAIVGWGDETHGLSHGRTIPPVQAP
jgi:hypothetical protein